MTESWLHIVLVEPEIPQNTGNVGRTCVSLGAVLHLVGKLGFSLDEKQIRRSGLDYWPKLKWHHHKDWDEFLATLAPQTPLHFISTKGSKSIWDKSYSNPCYLVFGNESRGLPPPFYQTYQENLVRIPMKEGIRSLNLATAVGVAAYEAKRQCEQK